MKQPNIYFNLIAFQSDDSEKLKRAISSWVNVTNTRSYPINFIKYFGLENANIPTQEQLAAYELLRDVDTFVSGYKDFDGNVLHSIITNILNTFNYIDSQLDLNGDVNLLKPLFNVYRDLVNETFTNWKDVSSRNAHVEKLVDETNQLMSKVRRLSSEVTGHDFTEFVAGEELDDRYDILNDDQIYLLSTLLTNEEFMQCELECLGAYMDDNTYVLALPTKNDNLVDFVHKFSEDYDLQITLYFGNHKTNGHIISTSGVTEFHDKEPERRTLSLLLDAVGLSDDELDYFCFAPTIDDDEEIDLVSEGAFGVN